MNLLTSSAGAGYSLPVSDDKDNSGFEFTRRKRWPQLLLQELVGSALFCLRPVAKDTGGDWTWRIVYASPSTAEMLGQKPIELEGTDFLNLICTADLPHVSTLFASLLSPATTPSSTTTPSTDPSPSQPAPLTPNVGKSQTVYARINVLARAPAAERARVVWELRAHATGLGLDAAAAVAPAMFAPGGAGTGTVVPRSADDVKGRAVWVMGRNVDGVVEGDAMSLEAFLELKLENERLREELKELQLDFDDEDFGRMLQKAANDFPGAAYPASDSEDESTSSARSTASSSPLPAKPRKKKDGRGGGGGGGAGALDGRGGGDARGEKKRKRGSVAVPAPGAAGEGMHVCVTCGRTDSPEWRKGPLGPKTLCNACGLRWAKRNSANAGRKDKKDKKAMLTTT
ncbi:white collar 2 type of transcription factor [Cryptotrichosporon argae]